jgi:hypothetical protein
MTIRAALLFLFVLVLAGCGSTAFERPGANAAQMVGDTDTCRVAATRGRLELQNTLDGRATLLLPVSELDQRAFADCMRQRGYVEGSID